MDRAQRGILSILKKWGKHKKNKSLSAVLWNTGPEHHAPYVTLCV